MGVTVKSLDARSLQLRRSIIDTYVTAKRGHIGSAFSLVEILRVLYDDVLRYDAANPRWPQRDRFILSKGHGCLALYAVLADKGFFPAAELQRFCRPEAMLGGHPEYGRVPGVEASTGSLGHGLPIAVGLAIHAQRAGLGHRVFVVCSDGESNEGSLWEALLAAHKHRLSNLTILVDYNKMQSYGTTAEVLDLEPFADKYRAFGLAVEEVDGHDVNALRGALSRVPFQSDRPSAIICHTIKGRGVSFVEHNAHWHHKGTPTDAERDGLFAELEE
jgi:transketolase